MELKVAPELLPELVALFQNPLHGVESSRMQGRKAKAMQRIHYMELKVGLTICAVAGIIMLESITWS